MDEAIADGATVFDDSPQVVQSDNHEEAEALEQVVVASEDNGTDEKGAEVERERGEEPEKEEKEYFKDGKVVFNKVSADSLKRKKSAGAAAAAVPGDVDDEGGELCSKKAKKQKKLKQKKQLGLLSFGGSDEF